MSSKLCCLVIAGAGVAAATVLAGCESGNGISSSEPSAGVHPAQASPAGVGQGKRETRQSGRLRRHTRELALAPRLPDRVVTYDVPGQDVEISYPAGWHRATTSLTPRLAKPGGILAVGSLPLRRGPDGGCSGEPRLPQVEIGKTDVLVHVEVQPDEHPAAAGARPRDFQLLEQVRPVDPARPASGQVFPWNCLNRVGIVGLWTFFGADRRVFYVTAVAGEDTSTETRRELLGVLESLRFGDG